MHQPVLSLAAYRDENEAAPPEYKNGVHYYVMDSLQLRRPAHPGPGPLLPQREGDMG